LCGNPSKANTKLGWTHNVEVRDLVREMVEADMKAMVGETIARNG